MEKIITACILTIGLSGCFGSKLTKPECIERPVYKKYDITMPERPQLEIETLRQNSTNGQATRAYELDALSLAEYAVKLENILKPIAEDNAKIPDLVPTEDVPVEKKETGRWWDWLF